MPEREGEAARAGAGYREFFASSGAACFLVSVLVSAPALGVSGAELVRNEPFRYGRFEARLRFAAGDGIVSTFFLWKDGSERPDIFWNEIDIEKLGANCNGYSSNALYGLPESNRTLDIVSTDDLCDSYHTHVVEWTPEYLAWSLDGVEVRRITGADAQAFEENALPGMQMRFNIWVGSPSFGGNFTSEVLPARQYINWVSYSAHTPGTGEDGSSFTRVWREDFDGALDAGWSRGDWSSPFDNSVHSPSNVTVIDGKAVLSLTPDDALGFTGAPPTDPADLNDIPDASPPRPAPSPTPTGAAGGSRARANGGCAIERPSHSAAGAPWWLFVVGAVGASRVRAPRRRAKCMSETRQSR